MSWDFTRELAAFGPHRSWRGSLSAARAYCARVARSHYENFTVVSLLLPRRLVPHFQAVYAFCRWADDLADETAGGDEALRLLDWWRTELRACYGGVDGRPHPPAPSPSRRWGVQGADVTERSAQDFPAADAVRPERDHFEHPLSGTERGPGGEVSEDLIPTHPVTVALADTVCRFAIPPTPFLDLIAAFEQDQRVKRYATFADVLDYCTRSANPVGRLVLHLFECFDDRRAALSDEVCTGLQLANFWQDVARDRVLGRVYIPQDDLTTFGVPDEDLTARQFTPAFRDLLAFQVARTRGYFDRGAELLPLLPASARVDVDLFIRGGRATLEAIARAGFDVLTRRPTVGKAAKAWLLLRAVAARLRAGFT